MSLYDALKQFRRKDRICFHIPGHNGGRGLNPDWVRDAFSLDVTEFSETDDLQNPSGILREAQTRTAAVFGAEESFFLTNGSSLGLEAAILAACKPGDRVLVDRTCHKAVCSAMTLSGCLPIFLSPAFDEERGLYTGISPRMVQGALEREPDIRGMVLTSPTYYGICSPIRELADILHQKGKFLIVDEAHGAHFGFHPTLPSSALAQGADIAVQSAHKTLPALGQTSLLHRGKDGLISGEQLGSALRLLMTTSPSYLLMSALDEAVTSMKKNGQALLEILLREIAQCKEAIREQGILDFADEATLGIPQDALRLVVDFRRSGLQGTEAAELLKEVYGIYPEMADPCHIVLIVTASNTVEELKILCNALMEIAVPGVRKIVTAPLPVPTMRMSPRDAWMSEKKDVAISSALGEIAADTVAVCPPGAALLIPGQYIDEETLAYCKKMNVSEPISVVK